MPIEARPFRREKINPGGVYCNYHYYFDPEYDQWMSVHESTILHGRNATGYQGFLRSVNGVQETGTHGPILPWDSTIVWISAASEVAPDTNLQVWSNGSNLQAFSWTAAAQYWTTDIDIAQGQNISVAFPLIGGATYPNRPVVHMGLRWRL